MHRHSIIGRRLRSSTGRPHCLVYHTTRRRLGSVTPASSSSRHPSASSSFAPAGPYSVSPLPPFGVPRELSEGEGDSDTVDASVELLLPTLDAANSANNAATSGRPLCIILPGFLLSARRSYRTLATHLCSHGYPAALVDLDDPSAPDKAAVAAAGAAAAACARAAKRHQRQQARDVNGSFVLIGHSRGAKLAALAAGVWERLLVGGPRNNNGQGSSGGNAPAPSPSPIAALVLLDPVDRATLGPPPSASYPSALPSVSALASRGVPILIVGAGDNGDIVEAAAGWRAFASAAAAGAGGAGRVVEVLLPRANHLDFADTQSDPLVGGLLDVVGNLFGGAGGVGGGGANAGRPPGEAAAVRRCADALAAFWAAACDTDGVEGAIVEAEVQSLARRFVPDARARVIAWGEGGRRMGTTTTAKTSREALASMRASQLQALLRERGVYYGDCFDRPSLIERVIASGGVIDARGVSERA